MLHVVVEDKGPLSEATPLQIKTICKRGSAAAFMFYAEFFLVLLQRQERITAGDKKAARKIKKRGAAGG